MDIVFWSGILTQRKAKMECIDGESVCIFILGSSLDRQWWKQWFWAKSLLTYLLRQWLPESVHNSLRTMRILLCNRSSSPVLVSSLTAHKNHSLRIAANAIWNRRHQVVCSAQFRWDRNLFYIGWWQYIGAPQCSLLSSCQSNGSIGFPAPAHSLCGRNWSYESPSCVGDYSSQFDTKLWLIARILGIGKCYQTSDPRGQSNWGFVMVSMNPAMRRGVKCLEALGAFFTDLRGILLLWVHDVIHLKLWGRQRWQCRCSTGINPQTSIWFSSVASHHFMYQLVDCSFVGGTASNFHQTRIMSTLIRHSPRLWRSLRRHAFGTGRLRRSWRLLHGKTPWQHCHQSTPPPLLPSIVAITLSAPLRVSTLRPGKRRPSCHIHWMSHHAPCLKHDGSSASDTPSCRGEGECGWHRLRNLSQMHQLSVFVKTCTETWFQCGVYTELVVYKSRNEAIKGGILFWRWPE